MAIFEKFPYSDLHNLNLDWIIEKVKQWQAEFEEYKTELETLESTVQGLINTVDQQDEDIQAAIGQLQTALEALPQDIQDEVAEQIGPAVASRIGPTVAAQLPAIAAPMVSQSTSDWLEDNMTEPPLDPSMSIRSAVPDAKDCGTIFTFLEDLEISGYERVTKPMTAVIQNDRCWDYIGQTGIKVLNGIDAYSVANIVGGVTYQLDGFYNGPQIPSGFTFRAAFVRDYVAGEALDIVEQYQRQEMEMHRWNPDETSFRLRAPFGSTHLLIDQVHTRGTVSIVELSNEFLGSSGEDVNIMVPLGALNVFDVAYPSITQALRMGGSVYFKFPEGTYNGMTAQVTAYKKNDGNDYSIVMVGPSDKLIKADMIYTSATGGGQLVNVTDVSIGGGGGSTSSIVINLTANQDSTYTGDIALADLQTFLDNADPIWLSYPGATENDYDLRQVVEYNQDLTDDTSLRIGVFSEDEYIVYSVVDDGNDGVTLTVVSEKGLGGSSVEIVTASATDSAVIGLAYQKFLNEARLSPGNNVAIAYEHDVYVLSDLLSSIGTAINQGKAVFLIFNITASTSITVPVSAIRRMGCIGFTFNTEDSISGTSGYSTVNANVTLSSDEIGVIITGAIYTGLES